MEYQSEDKVRNKLNEADDSLAEKKKIKNGTDVEPQAEEWVAKPVAFVDEDHTDRK